MDGTTTTDRRTELLERLAGPGARLRADQSRAVDELVAGHTVVLVQATGWGKSAVYWIAAAERRAAGSGPTVVISPLLALMRNQVASAGRAGIAAATINSANVDDWHDVTAAIDADALDVLLISPERLTNPSFRTRMAELAGRVGMLVVDEAHCISDWGHQFRPDYRRIAGLIDALPPGTPVLATTATANRRVTEDIAAQVGSGAVVLRGSLERASLALGVVRPGDAAERLAWLDGFARGRQGPGIVYALTVDSAELVASYLRSRGHDAVAYTGSTDAERRGAIEAALDAGELGVVVATSALGMGYDAAGIRWVVHHGSPNSPIAYYQAVGRAGRDGRTSEVVLLPTPADADIWAWMASSAMPPAEAIQSIVDQVRHGPRTLADLESANNLRRGRLTALLAVLDVEDAVRKEGSTWVAGDPGWRLDTERRDRLAQVTAEEQRQMLDYQQLTGCRLEFLRRHLDDPGAEPCGRCDNCTGTPVHSGTDAEAVAAARVALRSGTHVIEPRKRWPSGVSGRLLPAEPGRALAFAADDGWGGLVRAALAAPGDPVGEELAKGIFDVLRAWDWAERPSWVTWVPEGRGLPRRIAECIATAGRLDLVESVTRIATRPPQDDMENSVTQVRNVIGAFEVHDVPPGTGLLVDDTMRSGWTLAVVAHQLREAGAGRILPFVLWRKP